VLTVADLIAVGIAPTQARAFAAPLAAACERFHIDTPARIAGFLAQCRVESQSFTALEEGLFYRSGERIGDVFRRLRPRGPEGLAKLARNPQALANAAYAHINGNGPEASGDGWRYRGRGLKQLTGRANYAAAEAGLGRPYVDVPELVALPEDAALTAAWFWDSRDCNALADAQQWNAITRAVNGPAMLQAAERQVLSMEALDVLTGMA
jgi:putative chitinase